MLKEITCIICPNGCDLQVKTEGGCIESITGNLCDKGPDYVRQELTAPKRTVTSSVLVTGGELPLASVRTSAPIPKEQIFEAMKVIRGICVEAPVESGQVLVKDLLGFGCDVIATKTVRKGA